MRLLLIMHYGKEISWEQFKEKQNGLYSRAKSFCDSVVTFIFSEEEINDAQKFACCYGKVVYQDFSKISANLIVNAVSDYIKDKHFDCMMVEESELSNDITVLLATQKHLPFLTNVKDFSLEEQSFELTRSSYDNNLIVKHKMPLPCTFSLQGIDCRNCKDYKAPAKLEKLNFSHDIPNIISQKLIQDAEERKQSKLLIAVGMGVGEKTQIERIRNYALKNGFGFGVTRPVAMHGWAKISEIIGVSGSMYAPKICITIGISGSAAFYVGIEKSDFILSINTNEDAPINVQSDCVIRDDYKNIIDYLFQFLEESCN